MINKPLNQRKSYLMSEKLVDLMFENQLLEKYLNSESFRSQEESVIGMKFVLEDLRQRLEFFNDEYIDSLTKEEAELKSSIKSKRLLYEQEQYKNTCLQLELENLN